MFSVRQTSSLSNHPASSKGVKRRFAYWARFDKCSTRSRSVCQLRSPIHTIFSMILFIFNSTIRQPVTAGCNLCRRGDHAFSDPGSERLGISFFAVYKSLFRQACIQITHAAHQKFCPQRVVAVVGAGWRQIEWTYLDKNRICNQHPGKSSLYLSTGNYFTHSILP